ncbi:MAG TPA: GatB/YqeY domain-containing protein, partial [Candidatus Paceibacterota bacterium]|nr:GatB/YqeY domain-containing protein [Candidatus Paceibacterota bacterium]
MLHQQIKDEIKKAMLARETERLMAARNILAAFTNELVVKKQRPDEMLTDDALAVLKRLAKQRKDSIEQFTI